MNHSATCRRGRSMARHGANRIPNSLRSLAIVVAGSSCKQVAVVRFDFFRELNMCRRVDCKDPCWCSSALMPSDSFHTPNHCRSSIARLFQEAKMPRGWSRVNSHSDVRMRKTRLAYKALVKSRISARLCFRLADAQVLGIAKYSLPAKAGTCELWTIL